MTYKVVDILQTLLLIDGQSSETTTATWPVDRCFSFSIMLFDIENPWHGNIHQ